MDGEGDVAKFVVQNETDPQIAIVLVQIGPDDPEHRALGTHGTCTECGWPVHRWSRDRAISDAQRHVDGHDPVQPGGDRDSLIR